MTLAEEVSEKRREIRTDAYSMSIGEWMSLYDDGEIDIHPEFQRFYRWTETQKTNLVESIILGIPIPPIFVSQREDGVWDVVDGLQRLSTIYSLMGRLKSESGELLEPLRLNGTKYLPSLEGMYWDDPKDPTHSLPAETRLLIKRSKISASIILKESDETAKYDLFQRLNTGGTNLSPQEVRNCILVMVNRDFYEWLKTLSSYEPFQQCIALSDRPLQEAYDLELVLRFLVFSKINVNDLKALADVGVFLTDRMITMASGEQFPRAEYEEAFNKTFELLDATVGTDSFKRYNLTREKHAGGFLLSQFEVVALGLGQTGKTNLKADGIAQAVKSIWSNPQYTDWAGSGITATRRLPRLIPLGRSIFQS